MSGSGTIMLRKMSLRRAIWRARMAARSMCDQVALEAPERQATCLLRDSVKQQLRTAPLDGFTSGVYGVDEEWRLAVLRRDPQVLEVRTADDLAHALEGDEPVEVLATREAQSELSRLRDLAPGPRFNKTVFVVN